MRWRNPRVSRNCGHHQRTGPVHQRGCLSVEEENDPRGIQNPVLPRQARAPGVGIGAMIRLRKTEEVAPVREQKQQKSNARNSGPENERTPDR